jgi:hypothetical protein
MPPNMLFFIVNDRNIDVYRRIKKSCDIRFGVASQVLQAKHVMSASPQYISNVCMKVNAKLGGCTSVAKSQVVPKIAPKSASSMFPLAPLTISCANVVSSSHYGRRRRCLPSCSWSWLRRGGLFCRHHYVCRPLLRQVLG